MTYQIDEEKLARAAKLTKYQLIYSGLIYITVGYIIFFGKLASLSLVSKVLFFILLIIVGTLANKFRVKIETRNIRTIIIMFEDNQLRKMQNGKTIDSVDISDITSFEINKIGLIVNTKSRKKAFFVPSIIGKFEDLKSKIEQITFANNM